MRISDWSSDVCSSDLSLVELVEEGGIRDGVVLDEDTVFVTPNAFKRSYTDLLPSVNVRYEPARDIVLRAGAFKSVVRPNISKLAPRFVVEENDDGEREGEFGNPALKPYKAWNVDLSAEWYFGKNRSEEHTSELQSLMRISYAVFCLKKKTRNTRYM